MRVLIFIVFVMLPAWAHTQPRFGVEVGFGQSGGMTSYIDNVTHLQDETIYLADEPGGSGLAVIAAFVFEDLAIELESRWFAREELILHHRGRENFDSTGKVRPDSSVDDAGVDYAEIEERRIAIPDRARGQLFVAAASGVYRWYLLEGDFNLFIPFGLGISLTHIFEPTQPYVFGLKGFSGVTGMFDVSGPIALYANLGVHALITPSYRRQDDVTRSSAAVGESTLESMISTFSYASISIGFQFTVR